MKTHRETRLPCDNRGKSWSEASSSPGTPRIADKRQKPEAEEARILPHRFQREHNPANSLVSDL
jgi:hypothetical protein